MHIYVNMYICRYMYISIYKGTCVYIHIKVLLIFICMCICSTCVQLPTEVREGIRYPGPGVTGSCKPPIVGAGNKLKFSGRAASTLDH